jgi:hypothetical protein
VPSASDEEEAENDDAINDVAVVDEDAADEESEAALLEEEAASLAGSFGFSGFSSCFGVEAADFLPLVGDLDFFSEEEEAVRLEEESLLFGVLRSFFPLFVVLGESTSIAFVEEDALGESSPSLERVRDATGVVSLASFAFLAASACFADSCAIAVLM